MADTFHVTGFNVYFRGFHVATLETRAPDTVMADVVEALHAYHPDAIDPDDHKADLDALEKAEGDLYDANERIAQLERELEDERDTIANLEKQIAEMETELEAFDDERNDLRSQIAALESMLKAALT